MNHSSLRKILSISHYSFFLYCKVTICPIFYQKNALHISWNTRWYEFLWTTKNNLPYNVPQYIWSGMDRIEYCLVTIDSIWDWLGLGVWFYIFHRTIGKSFWFFYAVITWTSNSIYCGLFVSEYAYSQGNWDSLLV